MPRPFFNKRFEFSQPDGTRISLVGWGNQFFATFETEDGYTVVRNPVTKFYDYAKLSPDNSYLETTGVRVGAVDPATLGIAKHLRVSEVAATIMARAASGSEIGLTRWQERIREAKASKKMAVASRGIIAAPPERQTRGDYVGLCILIQFPDVKGTIQPSEVELFCNQNGYRGYGNSGSVNDYFSEVSGGRVNYRNIVTAYYTARNERAYYADPSIPYGTRARELIREALEYLRSNGFNFSGLSADSGGFIYAINAFYAGPTVNEWRTGIWPHCSSLSAPFNVGGNRKFRDYQITNMGEELTLGTFCHENGHMVCDFPDLYDYGFSGIQSSGIGNYCLMAFGGTDEKNPIHVCAYLKYKAGWADKVTAMEAGNSYMARAGVNEFFKLAKSTVEYYLIEARIQENRDKSLPSAGLAVWHVDELGDNEYEEMTAYKHFECSLVQADNKFDLERGINGGDAKDLFNKRNSPKLGEATRPNSKWWDGTPSGLEITEIGDAGTEIAFKFGDQRRADALKKSSSPDIFIPDNDQTGIKDTIIFEENVLVSSLKVDVDISHTYIGDLVVTLISPSGDRAIIHDKKGESEDDLRGTFDISTTPSLANLLGQPVKGTWTLEVKDISAIDKGKLNSWGLEIIGSGGMSNEINVEDAESQKIPDNNAAGVTRSLKIDSPGKVKTVEVTVDITHTYIGDLVVTLQSPKGSRIVLHDNFGAGQDNIMKTYSSANVPDLEELKGETISGNWSLKVADMMAQDVGKLNRWSLKIIPE
ncbi:MAG TPA: M6 family metalloprotease domain-containing protein, partial [Methanothrix sp.]|nr:M6 family metalloprotease domain-containing protein [Methanothrix sp.]